MRMRVAGALSTLLAVLCGAVASGGDAPSDAARARRTVQPQHSHRVLRDDEINATAAWKRSHWREMQSLMREGTNECCPSKREMVAPKGGQTPSGLYVKLYQDGENVQQFYEQSCAPGVADQPCRFVDARLYNQSRCVQKYSYSYALVRNATATEIPHHRHKREGLELPASGGWSLDYILVRAGCECEIVTQKKKTGRQRHRQRRKNKVRSEKDEET